MGLRDRVHFIAIEFFGISKRRLRAALLHSGDVRLAFSEVRGSASKEMTREGNWPCKVADVQGSGNQPTSNCTLLCWNQLGYLFRMCIAVNSDLGCF